jgi:hypothetical protein
MSSEDLNDELENIKTELLKPNQRMYYHGMYFWSIKGMEESCEKLATCTTQRAQQEALDQWDLACFEYKTALEFLYPQHPFENRVMLAHESRLKFEAINSNPHM